MIRIDVLKKNCAIVPDCKKLKKYLNPQVLADCMNKMGGAWQGIMGDGARGIHNTGLLKTNIKQTLQVLINQYKSSEYGRKINSDV